MKSESMVVMAIFVICVLIMQTVLLKGVDSARLVLGVVSLILTGGVGFIIGNEWDDSIEINKKEKKKK